MFAYSHTDPHILRHLNIHTHAYAHALSLEQTLPEGHAHTRAPFMEEVWGVYSFQQTVIEHACCGDPGQALTE